MGNVPNDLKTTLNNCQKYPVYNEYLPSRPKDSFVSLYDKLFSTCKVIEIRKCTELPQHELKLSKVPCIHYLPRRPNFSSVLLYDQRFSRYKVVKWEMTSTHFELLNVKRTSVYLYNQPFLRHKVVNNRKCIELIQFFLHLSVKSTLCELNSEYLPLMFVSFPLPPAVFEI